MAGKIFDSHDIRLEIGYTGDVVPGETTREEPSQVIVPFIETPTPLETIVPGDSGKEIDIKNLSEFSELNRLFSYANSNLSIEATSQIPFGLYTVQAVQGKGKSSSRPSLFDPEYTSGDYELVACKKNVTTNKSGFSTDNQSMSQSTAPQPGPQNSNVSYEEEVYLAQFLINLKKWIKGVIVSAPVESKDGLDVEMRKEFADNKDDSSDSSTSTTISESNFKESSDDDDFVADKNDDAEKDAVNTFDNIDTEGKYC